jgi:hypothetical protein
LEAVGLASGTSVTTSLLVCVGPPITLTIIGLLEDGLRDDYSLLALKSTLYFIAALTFASVLGWGVSLSVRTVLLVQGSLTLGAGFLDAVVNEARIIARTVIGGILIVGLSLGCSNVRRSGSRTCSLRSWSPICSSRSRPCAAMTSPRPADTLIFIGTVSERRDIREERTMEGRDREWHGSPLDVSEGTMDAYGIQEFVIEFDNGDEDVLRPKHREEFQSYELHQVGTYLDTLAHSLREGKKN